MAQPTYDVAISFLSTDEPIAAALYEALGDGFQVFFYPRKQENLAGRDGMEAMRTPFLRDSRVVVVLYRMPWGETPWTRVEQAAIEDGCLSDGWKRLFFMMLDKTSEPPKWVPDAYVRFNYADFGLEQAVGAIKARVQERGGTIAPVTAIERAELARLETEYLREKEQYCSPTGRDLLRQKTQELYSTIKRLCDEITTSGISVIEIASDGRGCHLRNGRVSLAAFLDDSYPKTSLSVSEFDKRLPFGGEFLSHPSGPPTKIFETRFLPELSRAREGGWIEEGERSRFLSSDALADKIVGRFVDLAARADRGEFRGSRSFPKPTPRLRW
ncbi:MAG: hypothetical protein WAN65_09800 [Candidatus Sulfotelmatobacter sp.]